MTNCQEEEPNYNHKMTVVPPLPILNGVANHSHNNGASASGNTLPVLNGDMESPPNLERDYYGCYCLKFIVKNGTHITEEKVLEDFGHFGEVVDVRGPGLFSGLRGNHVYVRFIDKADAEEALRHLAPKYHQLTPASISDVLPDNYGLYTISFYNKTGIPSSEVRKEFSKFGEVKNLTGSLDVKGGRVFVSYKEKTSAVQALQAFFFRKDKYPNMKFALPRCEKDYFGCYCLKFYNKSGDDVTEEKVQKDFGQFGEVVDIRGPGLFDVTGDDVYVRYKEKSSAEQALIELVGKYDSLCLAPPSDIQADKFGYYTITFVNDKCLSKSDVWYIFSKFGTVACVNGTFDCKKGRVFVSYKEKQGALNALETMLITKEYHLQVSKNSTVRKNDFNVSSSKEMLGVEDNTESNSQHSSRTDKQGHYNGSPIGRHHAYHDDPRHIRASSLQRTPMHHHRENSRGRDLPSMVCGPMTTLDLSTSGVCQSSSGSTMLLTSVSSSSNLASMSHHLDPNLTQGPPPPILPPSANATTPKGNGLVKFNRNVERDIFGYFCLSFLNEDGDISEKKVRHDFGKFGEVVSVRGALGKQKGHVFVRFHKKEAAENCLNCLNSFPLSEMSELFGKYLFLSPATPRDIDCDMYGLYSISFLNLNLKTFREIRQEFSKFGEIVRLTSGGGGNTDELVSVSYADKTAAIKALQMHFTNKEYPYLDIAKGSSLLLVNSSDSSDNEENESDYLRRRVDFSYRQHQQPCTTSMPPPPISSTRHHHHQPPPNHPKDPFHDPSPSKSGNGGSDVVDELLKPLQSYFNIYRTGQYSSPLDGVGNPTDQFANGHQRSPDKKYRIKTVKTNISSPHSPSNVNPSKVNPSNVTFTDCPPPNTRQKCLLEVGPGSGFTCPPPPIVSNGMMTPIHHRPPTLADAAAAKVKARNLMYMTTQDEVSSVEVGSQPDEIPDHISSTETSARTSREASEPSTDPDAKHNGDPDQDDLLSTVADEVQMTLVDLLPDTFGLFSVAFVNRSRELTSRKVRLDFGKFGDVVRVGGQFGMPAGQQTCSPASTSSAQDLVVVSFGDRESSLKAIQQLKSKYPTIAPAPPMELVPDKDGHFSIEFVNSGMSAIREITNVFSRYGEVMKVMAAGGAKNAIKRVTVSYSDKDAALDAVRAHANSKDFVSVDFSRECVLIGEPWGTLK